MQMHFIRKGPASLLMHDNDIEEIKIILKVFHQGGIQHKYMTRSSIKLYSKQKLEAWGELRKKKFFLKANTEPDSQKEM